MQFICVHIFIKFMILFQIELERLNTATDDINKLEVDLDVSIFFKA